MGSASPAEVVRRFYGALARRDGEQIAQLIDQSFSPGAVLALPPSLPYGGEITGAERLKRMFVGAVSAPTRVGPADVTVTDVIDGGDRVAVLLAFDWFAPGSDIPFPSSAAEIWTFQESRVAGIRAYYWDTAAFPPRGRADSAS